MSEHLQVLESAISGVGAWLGWYEPAAGVLDVEFGRVLLAETEHQPPRGRIVLRFLEPRLVYFLNFNLQGRHFEGGRWADLFRQGALLPFGLDEESFSLRSHAFWTSLAQRAIDAGRDRMESGIYPHMSDEHGAVLPTADEAILAFSCGRVGLLVAAKSLEVRKRLGNDDARPSGGEQPEVVALLANVLAKQINTLSPAVQFRLRSHDPHGRRPGEG